jgi:hypothetical protein
MTGYRQLTHFNERADASIVEAVDIFWSSCLFISWFLHRYLMRGPCHLRFDYEILYCSC